MDQAKVSANPTSPATDNEGLQPAPNQKQPPAKPARSGGSERSGGNKFGGGRERSSNRRRRRVNATPKEFNEKVINVNRVTNVTKGGRRFRFAALVVIGNRKGRFGFGTGKANEVASAIKKAVNQAHKNIITIPMVRGTIPHEVIGHYGGSRILIKPAGTGVGVVSGGAARVIMDFAGLENVYTKSFGSNQPINIIRATVNGIQQLRTAEMFAELHAAVNPTPVKDETTPVVAQPAPEATADVIATPTVDEVLQSTAEEDTR